MSFQVLNAFFKTLFYGCCLIGKNEKSRTQLKQRWATMVLQTFGFSLEIQGKSPLLGAQIIVGNHISYLDIVVLMAVVPELTFIAKDDLKKWPIIGLVAAAAGTIFVNRKSNQDRIQIREKVSKILLEKKQSIAIFPSGTTSLYEERPWKKGVFEIAKQSAVPIQLFRIDYTPLRPAAYIDDDQLLRCMGGLAKINFKRARLRWLDRIEQIDEPQVFAEKLRQKVISATHDEMKIYEI